MGLPNLFFLRHEGNHGVASIASIAAIAKGKNRGKT